MLVGYQTPSFGWLHIRRAQLVGAGSSAALTAHELVSIPHIRKYVPTCAIGLHGDRAARAVITTLDNWIEVFKWKECTSTELMVTNIRVKEDLRAVRRFYHPTRCRRALAYRD